MKGLFIPEITAEMFRNGCLESIESLMAEGEIYDIEYSPWTPVKFRPLTDEEQKEFPDYCYMTDCPDGYSSMDAFTQTIQRRVRYDKRRSKTSIFVPRIRRGT